MRQKKDQMLKCSVSKIHGIISEPSPYWFSWLSQEPLDGLNWFLLTTNIHQSCTPYVRIYRPSVVLSTAFFVSSTHLPLRCITGVSLFLMEISQNVWIKSFYIEKIEYNRIFCMICRLRNNYIIYDTFIFSNLIIWSGPVVVGTL